ncbi:MAG: hypothetical protein HY719_00780 [Planctomycetes bacterium]|nr:hypothetical protein [Planctomycetota bacterium]
MPATYADRLLAGEARAGIWRLNYLGFSTLHVLNRLSVRALLFAPERDLQFFLRGVGAAALPAGGSAPGARPEAVTIDPRVFSWCTGGLLPRPLAHPSLVERAGEAGPLPADLLAHFIGPPAENNGVPSNEALFAVARAVAGRLRRDPADPPLLLLECYSAPRTAQEVFGAILRDQGLRSGRDFLLASAPRRDWAIEDFERRAFPRLVGGDGERAGREAAAVAALFHDEVTPLGSPLEAEVALTVEYAVSHLLAVLAGQLIAAYPGLDFTRVLGAIDRRALARALEARLLPSGYALHSAADLLMEGADNAAPLSLLREGIAAQFEPAHRLVDLLVARGARRVGLLGFCSAFDQPAAYFSPATFVAPLLKARAIAAAVHDPLLSASDLARLSGMETFDFPRDIEGFDALVLLTDQLRYRHAPVEALARFLSRPERAIIDGPGLWDVPALRGQPGLYHRVGAGG